jgi:hypothetical protein
MRKPLDSFSSDLLKSFCVLDRLRYEFIAAMFWLIERLMVLLLRELGLAAALPWASNYLIGQWRSVLSFLLSLLDLKERSSPVALVRPRASYN